MFRWVGRSGKIVKGRHKILTDVSLLYKVKRLMFVARLIEALAKITDNNIC